MYKLRKKEGGDINNKLREYRLKLNYTQVDISKYLKISCGAYQNYEKGKRTPNVIISIQLAQKLNTTVEELFTATTNQTK